MNRRSLLLTCLGGSLTGVSRSDAQAPNQGSSVATVSSVSVQKCSFYVPGTAHIRTPAFVVGLDSNATKVFAYPVVVDISAKVLRTANRVVVLQGIPGDGALHLTTFLADTGQRDPRWLPSEITDPLEFVRQLSIAYQNTSARRAFNSAAHAALVGPGSLGETLKKLKSDVNAADPEEIARLERRIAAEAASIANSALAATSIALYDELGFSRVKVPVQVYRMHQTLSPQGEIPKGPRRNELMVLNRWLLDRRIELEVEPGVNEYRRQQDFVGSRKGITVEGSLNYRHEIAFLIEDPCFKVRGVREALIPKDGNLAFINYRLRLPSAGEKDAYKLDADGFIVEAPGEKKYSVGGDLKYWRPAG